MVIKEKYEAPQVEIIEVEVEKGFAGSTIFSCETENESMDDVVIGTFPWQK